MTANVRALTPEEEAEWREAWQRRHPAIPGRPYVAYLRSQYGEQLRLAREAETRVGLDFHTGIAWGLRYALRRYIQDLRVERAIEARRKRRHAT